MWENESELRDFIKKKLEEMGHYVKSEVTIRRFRIDLIAEKEIDIEKAEGDYASVIFPGIKKVVKAIEVKLNNRGEIHNAISRCINLSYFPEFDEVYVAFPKFYLTKEIQVTLQKHPIGAILVTEDGIEIITPPRTRKPASLHASFGQPPKVIIGKIFDISIGAYNDGEKNAYNVKFRWKPAKPFKRPKGEKNVKTVSKIEPGQSVSMSFKVDIRPKINPGKYLLFTIISADRLEPIFNQYEIQVERG